jgi:outer membrane lipopolysaccharide assembly protein LptE/RlpB
VAGWLAVMAILLLPVSCGYHLSGTGKLPGDVQTIGVSVLTNRTALSGLETIVTGALVDELTRRRQDLVVSADQSDAVLTGTIDALRTETLTRSSTLTAVERRMTITASFILKDRTGKVLWRGQRLTADQAYTVDNLRAETDRNLRVASTLVAQRLAEYVYERLTDAF